MERDEWDEQWVQTFHSLETTGIDGIVERDGWDEQWVQNFHILEIAGVVDTAAVEEVVDTVVEQWVQTYHIWERLAEVVDSAAVVDTADIGVVVDTAAVDLVVVAVDMPVEECHLAYV